MGPARRVDRGRLADCRTGVGDIAAVNLVSLPRGTDILEHQQEIGAGLIGIREEDPRRAHIEQRRSLPVECHLLAIEAEHRGCRPAGGVCGGKLARQRRRHIAIALDKEPDAVPDLSGADRLPAQGIDPHAELSAQPRGRDLVRMYRKSFQAPLPQEQ